jgi:hypothetical protein
MKKEYTYNVFDEEKFIFYLIILYLFIRKETYLTIVNRPVLYTFKKRYMELFVWLSYERWDIYLPFYLMTVIA